MKILIVDDEIRIREVVKEYALVNGYVCDEASDGKSAVNMALATDYDCIILDIMMPVMDGFEACKKIKEVKDTPIIMLSARQEEDDKLFSFNMGVDDYVTKPFSPKELMARIKAIMARRNKHENEKFIYKGLVCDFDAREVYIDKDRVNLTPKEKELLFYFIDNKNIVLSRDKISRAVWKMDYIEGDRSVDTHVKMLRKNLGEYRDLICTERGLGYKFAI
mgnify:FL=1